jgi:sugar lactone lactonase YvrE
MKRWLVRMAMVVGVVFAGLACALWLAFGGGERYPDLTAKPLLAAAALEAAVVFDRPIGNAAVAEDGRVFFTVHPEAHPQQPFLYVWKAGQATPFPAIEQQRELLQSPLGLVIDHQQRLWVIDPGNHGFGKPTLIAFNIDTGEVVHHHEFLRDVAPRGSFLQDLQISSNGDYVYIADVGFWAKRPALIVYDIGNARARRVLNRHPSVYPQNILIRTAIRPMRYFGGLVAMKTGVDGIALSRDDHWLYFAAMNHDTLFRVPTAVLNDFDRSEATVAAAVEAVGRKPLNDGLSSDDLGNVFITDVEHGAVLRQGPSGALETVIKDPRIRWADGLSFGPNGWLYLADSAIPHLVLQNAQHIAAAAPYTIWRFQPGTSAAAGQ